MAKIKYVARLNGQIVGTRSSERTYTHAVVINGHDKTDHVATWCGRHDLAQSEARKYQRYGFRADIVPAETLAPKATPTPVIGMFAIQEKRSPRGKFTMGNNPSFYRTAAEAFAMVDQLDEHGGCGPLRVVDQALNVIARPAPTTYGAWKVTEAEYIEAQKRASAAESSEDDAADAWQVVRYCRDQIFNRDQAERALQRIRGKTLTWRVGSNGNHFADAALRRYCVAHPDQPGGSFLVTISGYPIGKADSLEAGQAIAQAHHDRPAT